MSPTTASTCQSCASNGLIRAARKLQHAVPVQGPVLHIMACLFRYFPLFSQNNLNVIKFQYPMETDEILTINELSDYLKLAVKTTYRLASEGKIPGFKVGGSWRFRKSEIDRWIREQERKQGG